MASSLQLLLVFSFVFTVRFSVAQNPSLGNAKVLRVSKDASTLQYWTQLYQGPEMAPVKLVVDLGGPFTWLDCGSGRVSSTRRRVRCGSLGCSAAKAGGCFSEAEACRLDTVNAVIRLESTGELAEDIMAVDQMGLGLSPITAVDHFLFSCAPSWLVNGLASGAQGMLGLGRSRISLPSQLAAVDRKFAVCLSPAAGFVLSCDRPFPYPLTYTPLVSNQVAGKTEPDYYINVRSIKINGKKLSLNTSLLSLGTKLSTIVPYTTMESSIFETFARAYTMVAAAMNLTRMEAVAPFGACFRSDRTAPAVDLVLQSEMVKWRIQSMVEVGGGVMCLGFLDGGSSQRGGIILGGYQLEDHLLEFNLGTLMLGFSSSLLKGQTSCSDFGLFSSPIERA
ncbi:probable aspartic proteinase GIP2 [Diospyros lotus]|uniref:probable aspartic proteinase GIP2 n=1 Tax=Diospyros lotus TaxID=55363 RepID=UPI00224D7643|nr:probable aspartic proteinase GIP2 [Diospyros lotus]